MKHIEQRKGGEGGEGGGQRESNRALEIEREGCVESESAQSQRQERATDRREYRRQR